MDEIKQARKTVTVVSVQNLYNLGDRKAEKVLEYCTENAMGFIPWFPLAAGKIARAGGPLDKAAKLHGATQGQLALAWLLQRSPVVLPIRAPPASTIWWRTWAPQASSSRNRNGPPSPMRPADGPASHRRPNQPR